MKKTCCLLLLSLCAIAATIYATTAYEQDDQTVATTSSDPISAADGTCLHFRLAPFLNETNPLALSPEQLAGISSLIEHHQSVIEPLFRKINDTLKNVHQNVRSGRYDEGSMATVMNGLISTMAEALVEHERLDVKIFSIFDGKQRKQADEFFRIADIFFTSEHESSSESIAAVRMNNFLNLSASQIQDVDKAIKDARQNLTTLLAKKRTSAQAATETPSLNRFDEGEARKRATRQAKKMSTILIASENVTARVYGMLHEQQKASTEDTVAVIESCIRERIVSR